MCTWASSWKQKIKFTKWASYCPLLYINLCLYVGTTTTSSVCCCRSIIHGQHRGCYVVGSYRKGGNVSHYHNIYVTEQPQWVGNLLRNHADVIWWWRWWPSSISSDGGYDLCVQGLAVYKNDKILAARTESIAKGILLSLLTLQPTICIQLHVSVTLKPLFMQVFFLSIFNLYAPFWILV